MTGAEPDLPAQGLSFDRDGSVATLTVGTGARFNAMNLRQWRALGDAARSLRSSGTLRAVVVRGQGDTFCSGSDLREWAGLTAAQVTDCFAEIENTLQAIEDIPVPTVAVVEGVAAGGGCQLALACDLQLMADSARMGMPTSRLGILIPVSFANRLSMRVGPARAKALLYGGRLVDGGRADLIGLVTTTVPADRLDAELEQLLTRWGALSAASLRAAKVAVNLALAPVEAPARSSVVGLSSDEAEFTQRVDAFLHHSAPRGRR